MSTLRFLTAGESHGPLLTGVLEGLPAGLPLTPEDLNLELSRRQRGQGSGPRMKLERDEARITAGVMNGKTTGGPLALQIENLDHAKWSDVEIPPMTVPRPGHADLTAAVKYGYGELRLSLERASARETAMRVALGAVCRQLLLAFAIRVGGYVRSVGEVAVPPDGEATPDYAARFAAAEDSEVRCYDEATAALMTARIKQVVRSRDTLGGVIECVALGLPPGLGSHVHWDRRLSTRLAAAAMSIPSVKGVELGDGFAGAARVGTAVHDELLVGAEDTLVHATNHAGGIEGGITNGAPLILRAALKPIATTLTPLRSVDLASFAPEPTRYERSDFCQVPRAVPILEAMVCFVLADALSEKLGGDSLPEMQSRYKTLRKLCRSDLPMDNVPWRFGYR